MEDPAEVAAEVGQGGEEAVCLYVHAQHVLQVARKVAGKDVGPERVGGVADDKGDEGGRGEDGPPRYSQWSLVICAGQLFPDVLQLLASDVGVPLRRVVDERAPERQPDEGDA